MVARHTTPNTVIPRFPGFLEALFSPFGGRSAGVRRAFGGRSAEVRSQTRAMPGVEGVIKTPPPWLRVRAKMAGTQ